MPGNLGLRSKPLRTFQVTGTSAEIKDTARGHRDAKRSGREAKRRMKWETAVLGIWHTLSHSI